MEGLSKGEIIFFTGLGTVVVVYFGLYLFLKFISSGYLHESCEHLPEE